MACKPSELEYWNGAVVRLGKEAGVATPLNEVIYYSLLPQEKGLGNKLKFPCHQKYYGIPNKAGLFRVCTVNQLCF